MAQFLYRFIKQPLVHFLLAGMAIFVIYEFTEQPKAVSSGANQVIDITRASLLNFMQYRAQAFETSLFNDRLDKLDEEELEELVAAYVREEALHREAIAMGMDQGDYIIRQRLVQKVEFLLDNIVNKSLQASPEQLEDYYLEHQADYRVDEVYTFTHIFFDGENRGWDTAEQDAKDLLNSDLVNTITFNDASQYGDRYPFLKNYVERSYDFVVNNFTQEFVTALQTITPSADRWVGPLQSRYGFHLVLLQDKSASYVPKLSQILARVTDDWRYEVALESRRKAEGTVIESYEINLDLSEPQR